ncbi:MAG: prepilin-type N-terminal cleavage/methylation domain-containing protein [Candidatus Magasanikbacteria bacterium]
MKGFTLIEVLVVVGIIIVISALSLPFYGKFVNMNSINSQVTEVRKNIRLAQEEAQAGKHNSNHGIHFTTTSYTHYVGSDFNSRDKNKDEDYDLNNKLEFISSFEVNFSKDTGLPSATGTITIKNTNNGKTADISINEEGLIY